ncbi:hypothetical protein BT69DRAFT_1291082 [Atractiella rhizophila]|nr:hypothetical protein BT69DRAFT_1291082 [Atractiella rhizophila]
MLLRTWHSLNALIAWRMKHLMFQFNFTPPKTYSLYVYRESGKLENSTWTHFILNRLLKGCCRWLKRFDEATKLFPNNEGVQALDDRARQFKTNIIKESLLYAFSILRFKRLTNHQSVFSPNREKEPLFALQDMPGGFRNVANFLQSFPGFSLPIASLIKQMKLLSWRYSFLGEELDAFEDELSSRTVADGRDDNLFAESEAGTPKLKDFCRTLDFHCSHSGEFTGGLSVQTTPGTQSPSEPGVFDESEALSPTLDDFSLTLEGSHQSL